MDAVGVDGALLVSPFTLYGYDASYALEVHAAHPDRFGLIKPVNPTDARVEDTIADWAAADGTVGIRVMLNRCVSEDPADPGMGRVLSAAAHCSLPVNLLRRRRLNQVGDLAARNPNTRLVIDHLGLQQPFGPPVPAQPFRELVKLLALAAHDNIAVKITGACTRSRETFPYNDIWDPLFRIFDAFGFDRCRWGTEDRRSDGDRAALMGETLSRVYNWSPQRFTPA